MPTRSPYEDEDAAPPLSSRPSAPASPAGGGSARPPSASAGATPSSSPQPVPSPSPTPTPLRFGVCGVLEKIDELETELGQIGIIRYVTSGVTYTAPPASVQPCAWLKHPRDPQRYECLWDVRNSNNLLQLRQAIEQAVQSGEIRQADSPVGDRLDRVVYLLAQHIASLHREGWSAGLICPENVFYKDDGSEVFLADLGFYWKPARGEPPWDAEPGRPEWIEANWTYAWLYSRPPLQQQFACRSFAPPVWEKQPFTPPTPAEDVQTFARLLWWLVVGNDRGPQSLTPFLNLLHAAIEGQVADMADFLAQLERCPPSSHFNRARAVSSRGPSPLGRRTVLLLGAAVLVIGAAGLAYYLLSRTPPEGEDRKIIIPSPEEFAQKPYEEQMKYWRDTYNPQSPLTDEQKATLAKLRCNTLQKVEEKHDELVDKAFDHAERFNVAREFKKLLDDVKLLRSKPVHDPEVEKKEQLWQEIIELRLLELEA
ncbi:hypothetical protein [Thermogemmata fonticola]|uniref:Protein kinase domain-containing protein n=1 Tax=Thermogemmata fonticola TaxID=2755323 RepID=A0A7V8VGM4_9BACT|nr:hypothetical protein [Thermogemmata fonticola]MBA2227685.1 hypothetical protein [Thermogemmata fonticola]